MIKATSADIGRRVIYDPRPMVNQTGKGVIADVTPRGVWVLFNGADDPLCIGSHLKWADRAP